MNIEDKVREKNAIYVYDGSVRKYWHYVDRTSEKIKINYNFKGKKKRRTFFKKIFVIFVE